MSEKSHKSLIEIINEYMKSDKIELPAFDAIALKLNNMLAKQNFIVSEVAATINEDPVLTSQLLRIANSAFYAGLSKVATVQNAVMRLGAKEVVNMVMIITQKSNYNSKNKTVNLYMEALWKHALGCAMGAKWLAKYMKNKDIEREAFLGGLLHDIGKLFLLKVLESIHRSKKYDINISSSVIQETIISMHAEQGFMLLEQWNLPEIYGQIAREHQLENFDPEKILLVIVRLANLTCHKLGIGYKHADESLDLASTQEAQILNISDIHLAEMEIMVEEAINNL